ncbi:hypothetical protein K501DRAFT_281340 [Backusella circina FSU 941]|nr:hypothetical protein K501DRAFT_281340 [Backusella circina FSU 941]
MSSDFDDYLMEEQIEDETTIYFDKRIINCFSLDMISPPNTPPATPIYNTAQQQPLKKSRRSLVESSKAIEQRLKLREQEEILETPPTKKKRKLLNSATESNKSILKYLKQSQNAEGPNVVMGKPTKKMGLSFMEEDTDLSDVMSDTTTEHSSVT